MRKIFLLLLILVLPVIGQQRNPKIANTIADMGNIVPTDGDAVMVLNRASANDGGGGLFIWEANSGTVVDGGTVFGGRTGFSGRWKRVIQKGEPWIPQWFGAKGDGVTDDRAAIQAALTAGPKWLHIPDGTYILDVPSNATGLLNFSSFTSMKLTGDKGLSILKIKDGVTNKWHGLLYFYGSNTYQNFHMSGITINGNATGAPPATNDNLVSTVNYHMGVYLNGLLTNAVFEHNIFRDFAGVNCIAGTLTGGERIWVQNNEFIEIGQVNSGDHDHTSVYINVDKVWVLNNIFIGRTNTGGANTAWESHGSFFTAMGNYVNGYERGTFVSGARSDFRGKSFFQNIYGNTFTNVKVGITLYPIVINNPTNYSTVMSAIKIKDNSIWLNRDAFPYESTTYAATPKEMGIEFLDGWSGVSDILVEGNSIYFNTNATTTTSVGQSTLNSGISIYWPTQTAERGNHSVTIRNNNIYDPSASGIFVYASNRVDKIVISGNNIFGAGRDSASSVKNPIYFQAPSADYAKINHNFMEDNKAAPTQSGGVLIVTPVSSLDAEAIGNIARIGTNNVTPVSVSSTSTNDWWKIRGDYRGNATAPTVRAKRGSLLFNENTAVEFIQVASPGGQSWVPLASPISGVEIVRLGNALFVDGTNSVVVTGTSGINVATNDISIGVTLRPRRWTPLSGTNITVFATHSTGNNRLEVQVDDLASPSTWLAIWTDNSGTTTTNTLVSPTTPTDGTMAHVLLSADRDGSLTMFWNGVAGESVDISSLAAISIGSGNANPWIAFKGWQSTIYDLSVWQRTISSTEVSEIAKTGQVMAKDQWGSTTADYTSDFSAGTDSWTSNTGGGGTTLTGNVDAIDGQDNWLKVERTGADGYADVARTMTSGRGGKSQRIYLTIHNDAASTVTHFKVNYNGNSGQTPTVLAVAAGDTGTGYFDWPGNRASGQALIVTPSTDAGVILTNAPTGTIYYVKSVTTWLTGGLLALDMVNVNPAQSGTVYDLSGNANHGTLATANVAAIRLSPQINPGAISVGRITKAQRDAIVSPPDGLMIYQTDGTVGMKTYIGGAWFSLDATADP